MVRVRENGIKRGERGRREVKRLEAVATERRRKVEWDAKGD